MDPIKHPLPRALFLHICTRPPAQRPRERKMGRKKRQRKGGGRENERERKGGIKEESRSKRRRARPEGLGPIWRF